MKRWSPARRLLVRRVITAGIAAMALIQAIYHLATGGLPSFITETIAGAVLLLSLWLSYKNTGGNRKRWLLIIERCALISMAAVLLAAGIYHGTHQGYYSGTLQPIAAGLLGFAAFLSFD